jgi:hypothetical protein
MAFPQSRDLILTLAVACGLCFAAPALRAQQDPSQGPGGNIPAQPNNSPQTAPGPIGGMGQDRLGQLPPGRSFVIPRLSLQEVYDSNGGYSATPGASQADAVTSIFGGLTLDLAKRNSLFSLDYSSGGLIYSRGTQSNGVVQQLGLTEKITLRRWSILIGENFSYLPNSGFGLGGQGLLGGGATGLPGLGGGTGLTGIGGGATGLNPSVVPGQSIVAPNVSQLSSSTVFQAQYFVSPTSSLNASGSVGFLHFFGSELLNSRDITARFGYDKSLTARDTISLSYMASILDYPSGIPGFYTQYIQVGYRRFLKARLNLTVAAGPAISHFTPMSGQTTVAGGANRVDWSALTTLEYRLRNGALSGQYNHGVSAGSGYFPGTTADTLTVSLRHQLTRVWSVELTGGFARNSSLQQTTAVGSPNTTSTFDYLNGGLSVSRPLGHFSTLRFFYNASRQTGNTTTCVGGLSCGPIALTQIAGVSYNWSTRPLSLD